MLGALRTRSRTSASIRPPHQKLDAGRLRARRKTVAPTPLMGCPFTQNAARPCRQARRHVPPSPAHVAIGHRCHGGRVRINSQPIRPDPVRFRPPRLSDPRLGDRPQRATQASPLHDAGNGDITAAMAFRVDRHVTAARLWSEATAGEVHTTRVADCRECADARVPVRRRRG
jgi:hypothetical protein